MDAVLLIARVLFVVIFLASSIGHFTQTEAMTGYAQSRGVPAARVAVLLSGALLLLGGVSVLLGLWGDLGALLLVVFLLPTAVFMHGFWRESDPGARMTETIQFNKDLGLAGGALAFFVLYARDAVGYALTGPLLGLG